MKDEQLRAIADSMICSLEFIGVDFSGHRITATEVMMAELKSRFIDKSRKVTNERMC